MTNAALRPHRHNCVYTEEERTIIRSEIGITSPRDLAARLGRSVDAIVSAAELDHLYPETIAKRSAGLSFADVYTYLGVDCKTVFVWMRRGYLRARRIDTANHATTRRVVYTFSYDDVERFVRERGGLYLLRPVEGWREIYEAARADLLRRYIARSELGRLLSLTKVDHLLRAHGFPRAVVHGTGRVAYHDRAAVRAWLDAHPRYWTSAAREGL